MNGMMKKLLCLGLVSILCLGTGVTHGASGPLNPGFETGDFTDWGFVFPNTSVVSDNGPSAPGSFAASMTQVSGHEQAISKAIPISAGVLLDFSFDYKTLAGATGSPQVLLRYWTGVGVNGFSDGGGGVFQGQHAVTLGLTSGAWATNTLTNLPYLGGDHVDVAMFINAFTGFSGTARFDNFNVVPEPATLSLLSLGGLAMCLRRRNKAISCRIVVLGAKEESIEVGIGCGGQ